MHARAVRAGRLVISTQPFVCAARWKADRLLVARLIERGARKQGGTRRSGKVEAAVRRLRSAAGAAADPGTHGAGSQRPLSSLIGRASCRLGGQGRQAG